MAVAVDMSRMRRAKAEGVMTPSVEYCSKRRSCGVNEGAVGVCV